MSDFDIGAYFKQHDKIINNKTFTIKPLGVKAGWRGWTLLLEMVGPIFGEVIDSRNVDEAMMFEKQNTFREILTIVSSKLRTPDMEALIDEMLVGAQVDGQPLDVERDFAGSIHSYQTLIMFALEVNFKGFFTESDIFQSVTDGFHKMMGRTDIEEE